MLIFWTSCHTPLSLCPQVAAYPTLLPATVDAMPENLARATRLSKALPAADWNRLRTAAYQRAGYRCLPFEG